jgi:acetyltransferase-like isoleucine patch superfamily enzyme
MLKSDRSMIRTRRFYRAWLLLPVLVRKPLASLIRKSVYFLREVLVLVDEPAEPKHPFVELILKGDIHETVIFTDSTCNLQPGSIVKIGKNSIFHGKLYFYQPASFSMGSRSYIGPNTSLHVVNSICVGNDVMISSGCTLMDSNMHSLRFSERKNDVLIAGNHNGFSTYDKNWAVAKSAAICIQDKVWIGLNSIILKGVTLGEGCVVGAGSVVSEDVPPWTIVAGNPARIVRELSELP